MSESIDARHAVYAGSFDPLTLGHQDIVRRGARVFDRLTVAIGINPDKQPLFSAEERLEMARQVFSPIPNVDVICFEGLTVTFVRQCGAAVMLRGIRTLTDLETEFTMTLANRALDSQIETVFLMAGEKYAHVSSTLIKQIARMGGAATAKQLEQFLPAEIITPVLTKYTT